MNNQMYGMPNYGFQNPFSTNAGMNYQMQQLLHYDIVKVNGRNGALVCLRSSEVAAPAVKEGF